MIETSIRDFLIEQHRAIAPFKSKETVLDTPLFQMVLSGAAKLPLDHVEEVADLLSCNKHELFRMAMRQFYDQQTTSLFERMLGCAMSDNELQWLDVIRSASPSPVAKPNPSARRLVRALARSQVEV